jgi:hypothetical protein
MNDMETFISVGRLMDEYFGIRVSVEWKSSDCEVSSPPAWGREIGLRFEFHGKTYEKAFWVGIGSNPFRVALYHLIDLLGKTPEEIRLTFNADFRDVDDRRFVESITTEPVDVIRSMVCGHLFGESAFSEECARIKLEMLGVVGNGEAN